MAIWSGFDKTNVSLKHLGSRLKQIGSCPQFLDNLGLLGPVLCFVSIWSGFDKTNVSLEHLGHEHFHQDLILQGSTLVPSL